MARLFIAVWPPDEVIAELTPLRRKDQRGVRFVPPEQWHITLRFFGDTEPAVVAATLDDVDLPAATVRLGPAVDVLAERALIVPADGLSALASSVVNATKHIGKPPRTRFVGHLTLARFKPFAQMPATLGQLVRASFDVAEIALAQSRLSSGGPHYETIETWPVASIER